MSRVSWIGRFEFWLAADKVRICLQLCLLARTAYTSGRRTVWSRGIRMSIETIKAPSSGLIRRLDWPTTLVSAEVSFARSNA